jgi:hypothetical protein
MGVAFGQWARYRFDMSTRELLQEIETLPKPEQLWLLEQLAALTEDQIPVSFKQSLAEAERGELMDLDEALKELDRP